MGQTNDHMGCAMDHVRLLYHKIQALNMHRTPELTRETNTVESLL